MENEKGFEPPDLNEQHQIGGKGDLSRRAFLGMSSATVASFSGIVAAFASTNARAATFGDGAPNLITVGVGGKFADLTSATNSIVDAAPDNIYCILLLPGRHVISQQTTIPMYTHVVGISRFASELVNSGPLGMLFVSNNSSLSHFTFRYNSSPWPGQNAIWLNSASGVAGESFAMESVDIHYQGTKAAFRSTVIVNPCYFRDVTIYTASVGIDAANVGHMYLHDTDIFLSGNATGSDKICILARSGGRVYVFSGKFGTGYGVPQISDDPLVDFVGFDIGDINRFTVFDAWMIVRQDAVGSSGAAYCVRLSHSRGWVRLSGGYYQAENPESGGFHDVDNTVGGKVEIYPGTRIRGRFINGDTFGYGFATGVEYLATGLHSVTVAEGGIKKCDTTAGDVIVEILDGVVIGEQSTFVRIAGSGEIVVRGQGGVPINGQPSISVGPNLYDKVTVQRLDNEFIAW